VLIADAEAEVGFQQRLVAAKAGGEVLRSAEDFITQMPFWGAYPIDRAGAAGYGDGMGCMGSPPAA